MAWASQTASPHLANVGCRERICMSASVPWSVNAVEPEAWAAAREAARRSGMSVGEWLEAAIRENAEDTRVRRGRRRATPPPDDRLEDIAEELHDLLGIASGSVL